MGVVLNPIGLESLQEEQIGHRQARREGHMKTLEEGGPLQSKKGGSQKKPTLQTT